MRVQYVWRRLGTGLPYGLPFLLAVCAGASGAVAQKTDWTAKLEPRTRAMQVCNYAGLTAFGRDKSLKPRPDRVLVNAAAEPKIEANQVIGTGGAVRSGQHWYAFSFKCALNAEGSKASSFTYELGKEIPKARWEKLGLWE